MSDVKRFPWKLFSRIVTAQALLVLTALAVSGLAARYFYKKQFLAQVERQLHISLGSLSRDLPSRPNNDWCRSHSYDPSFRLTVIAGNGAVLCDSHHDPMTMENHLHRPEVQQALRAGFGHSVRYSATLSENMLYGALADRAKDGLHGMVLRGAIPLDNLILTLRIIDVSLALSLVVCGIALVGLALWSGRRLALPIGRLLLKARRVAGSEEQSAGLEDQPYGELSELDLSLDQLNRDLVTKAENLGRERDEQATIMSALTDAVVAVDLSEAILFFNSRFAVLFGSGARLWELIRDPDVLGAFRAALREGQACSINTFVLAGEAGRKFFSLSVAPLRRSTNNELYGAVGVFHDVTDLKRAEQIRIDFVANVSHELRTPLTAIKGYVDTLQQDVAAGRPVVMGFVDVIGRNTARLMRLINDLLDLSSLESSVDDFRKSELNIEEASARVLKQLESLFSTKRQVVTLDVKTPYVYADARRLEQVLVNLLDNASKYTPAEGLITLAWEKDLAANSVLLKVSDTGPGIPLEHHARLFERFYRVDKARSRELGGTGLGLAIVKHIMQRHGGTVWVESTVGSGSLFICRFPSST